VPSPNNCWDEDEAGTSWLDQKGATQHNQNQQKKKDVGNIMKLKPLFSVLSLCY